MSTWPHLGLAPHIHCHLQVWHTAHYNLLGVHTGHTEPVLCLAFDGNFLVSGSQDGTIRLWDAVPVGRESVLSARVADDVTKRSTHLPNGAKLLSVRHS